MASSTETKPPKTTGDRASRSKGSKKKSKAAPRSGPLAVRTPIHRVPRWSLGLLDLVHAAVFGAAARFLPWPDFSVFAAVAGLIAIIHAARAALALTQNRWLVPFWRWSSVLSLVFLAYLTYSLVTTAAYVSALYGTLGDGVAAAGATAWCCAALFTLPLSAWGIAVSGGVRLKPISPVAMLLALLIAVPLGGAVHWRGLATLDAAGPAPVALDASPDEGPLRAAIDAVAAAQPPVPEGVDASLYVGTPATCEAPIDASTVTALVAYLQKPDASAVQRKKPLEGAIACLQAPDLDAWRDKTVAFLAEESAGGRVKIDVMSGVQAVPDINEYLGIIAVRPGRDGVCFAQRCLAPWQLVALDQFRQYSNVATIQLKFGTTAFHLRRALGDDSIDTAQVIGGDETIPWAGINRVATHSFLIDDHKTVRPMLRGREPAKDVTQERVVAAIDGAVDFIVKVQHRDGRFGYIVDPVLGSVTYANFSVPRQAGTTLAICELGEPEQVKKTAQASLRMLATLERQHGDLGALVYPRGNGQPASLGSTALSMIAFLGCRGVVGPEHDALIERMANFMVAMQREDGSFHPNFDFGTGAPSPGPDPMYAEGQVIFALVLLEALGDDFQGKRPADLHAIIDRAMDHFSGPYWDYFVKDFFFLEENWHCLAARAALKSHRHDGYERFCMDYVSMKERLTFDEDTAVDADLVGAYGFGNVLSPHNTATAGYAEALAAKMAIAKARGEESESDTKSMMRTLRFLLAQQWTVENCFQCTTKRRIPGAFSEHVGSPEIRIDYVQHALSGIGHGAQMVHLLPES